MKKFLYKILVSAGLVGVAMAAGISLQPACDTVVKQTDIGATDVLSAEVISDKQLTISALSCGTYEAGVLDIPDDATRARITLTRDSWIEKGAGVNVAQVRYDIFDGTKWSLDNAGATFDGGDRVLQDGKTISPESYYDFPLFEGKGRKIKARIISEENLTTIPNVKFY